MCDIYGETKYIYTKIITMLVKVQVNIMSSSLRTKCEKFHRMILVSGKVLDVCKVQNNSTSQSIRKFRTILPIHLNLVIVTRTKLSMSYQKKYVHRVSQGLIRSAKRFQGRSTYISSNHSRYDMHIYIRKLTLRTMFHSYDRSCMN